MELTIDDLIKAIEYQNNKYPVEEGPVRPKAKSAQRMFNAEGQYGKMPTTDRLSKSSGAVKGLDYTQVPQSARGPNPNANPTPGLPNTKMFAEPTGYSLPSVAAPVIGDSAALMRFAGLASALVPSTANAPDDVQDFKTDRANAAQERIFEEAANQDQLKILQEADKRGLLGGSNKYQLPSGIRSSVDKMSQQKMPQLQLGQNSLAGFSGVDTGEESVDHLELQKSYLLENIQNVANKKALGEQLSTTEMKVLRDAPIVLKNWDYHKTKNPIGLLKFMQSVNQ